MHLQSMLIDMGTEESNMVDKVKIRRAVRSFIRKHLTSSVFQPEFIPNVFETTQVRLISRGFLYVSQALPHCIPWNGREHLLKCGPVETRKTTTSCADND